MVEGGMGVLWTCAALLALSTAGPLHRYPREAEDYPNIDLSAYANYTANEVCFSDNEVFQKGDMMPNPGPCEECRCEPPSIVCNMIKCPTNNNGCRTIQRANHCCPDYNCECDYNGQLYNDGERLDVPEEPCQVCYCKGGEVMCTSITCYHRDDCDPIKVPGQCCPKYENCPVRDMGASSSGEKNVRMKSTNKTSHVSPKREMTPWLLTKSVVQTSGPPVTKQDLTTEDGNVVIVSDWLTERRTTTEDGAVVEGRQDDLSLDHTNGPLIVTGPDHLTTQKHVINTINPDGSIIVRNSDVITPLEEVVFTRIDTLRGKPKDRVDSSTTNPLKTLQSADSSGSTKNMEKPSSEKTTSHDDVTPSSHNVKTVDEALLQEKYLGVSEPGKEPNIVDDKENEITSTVIDYTTNPTEVSIADIKSINKNDKILVIKDNKKESESSTNIYTEEYTLQFDNSEIDFQTDKTQSNSVNVSSKVLSSEKHVDSQSDSLDERKDIQVPEEITLEHLFGLDKSEEEAEIDVTTAETITTKTDDFQDPETKETRTEATKIDEDVTEDQRIYSTITGSNEQALSSELKKDKVKLTEEKVDSSEDLVETTVNLLEGTETTTPYFTEDHVSGENLERIESKQESVEETTIFNEETTTENYKTSTVSQLKSGETAQEVPLEKIIEESEEFDVTDMSTVHTPIPESFDTTDPAIDLNSDSKNQGVQLFNTSLVNNDTKVLSEAENKSPPQGKLTALNYEENLTTNPPLADVLNYTVQEPFGPYLVKDKNTSPESDEAETRTVSAVVMDDDSKESKEVMSDAPPVLELNSHVPFLQLGGHDGSESYSDVLEDSREILISANKEKLKDSSDKETLESDNKSDSSTNDLIEKVSTINSLTDSFITPNSNIPGENSELRLNKTENNINNTEVEMSTIDTTSHIPLTPGDLKTLAEYLINETIKPVSTKNESEHVPNQWLKGNLTSEEKITSILTAANVTIGIMNQTDSGTRTSFPETSTRSNEIIRIDKFEKEAMFKGNSILSNAKGSGNKTGYLHNKNNEILNHPKNYVKPENPVNFESSKTPTPSSVNEEYTTNIPAITNIKSFPVQESMSQQNFPSEKAVTSTDKDIVGEKNNSNDIQKEKYRNYFNNDKNNTINRPIPLLLNDTSQNTLHNQELVYEDNHNSNDREGVTDPATQTRQKDSRTQNENSTTSVFVENGLVTTQDVLHTEGIP